MAGICLSMGMANDDWQLLSTYARERSQDAFARLVARYADLVFAAAMRRCRDRQLAEDVTQAVFIVLARSAARLKPTGSLAAWLHKTTLHATANALRAEVRRRKREHIVARHESISDTVANGLAPGTTAVLEDELHRLAEADRQVLAIHYLEDRTMAQTADALGVSIEAVRKRISRALDKLRARLARRGTLLSAAGVASAAGAITAAVPSQASAAQVASLAIAGGKGGAAFSLASELIRMTRLAALQKAVAVLAVSVGLTATLIGVVEAKRRGEPTVASAPPAIVSAPTIAPVTTPSPAAPATASPTTRPSVALPEVIRQALLQNATQVGPTITVAWTSQARSRMTVDVLTKVMKIDERWAEDRANGRATMRCTWQDGKYLSSYRQLMWPTKPDERCHYVESSFDGEDLFMGSTGVDADGVPIKLEPGVIAAGFSVDRLANKRTQLDSQFAYTWYFDMIGLRLPTRFGDLQKQLPVRSSILVLLEEGAQLTDVDEVEIEGRKLTRLRIVLDNPDRRHAEKVDLEKHAAMLRERTAETEEGVQDLIAAIAKARQLPEQMIHVF